MVQLRGFGNIFHHQCWLSRYMDQTCILQTRGVVGNYCVTQSNHDYLKCFTEKLQYVFLSFLLPGFISFYLLDFLGCFLLPLQESSQHQPPSVGGGVNSHLGTIAGQSVCQHDNSFICYWVVLYGLSALNSQFNLCNILGTELSFDYICLQLQMPGRLQVSGHYTILTVYTIKLHRSTLSLLGCISSHQQNIFVLAMASLFVFPLGQRSVGAL